MLKEVFFSSSLSVDLSNLQRYIYSTHTNCLMKIVEKEIVATLSRSRLDKTSESNDITNRILKTCIESLTKLLTSLFQTCVFLKYHSRAFRKTHIITLKKMRRTDYTTSKVYKSIVLLNTLNKALEFIMIEKIAYLTEHHRLLSKTQIRNRKDRFTDIALELLTKQMHIV